MSDSGDCDCACCDCDTCDNCDCDCDCLGDSSPGENSTIDCFDCFCLDWDICCCWSISDSMAVSPAPTVPLHQQQPKPQEYRDQLITGQPVPGVMTTLLTMEPPVVRSQPVQQNEFQQTPLGFIHNDLKGNNNHLAELEKLKEVLQMREERIRELEIEKKLQNAEIAELRSQLDKFLSVLPFKSSLDGGKLEPRKHRAQGISAEPLGHHDLQTSLKITIKTEQ